jgi:hypothetical protein
MLHYESLALNQALHRTRGIASSGGHEIVVAAFQPSVGGELNQQDASRPKHPADLAECHRLILNPSVRQHIEGERAIERSILEREILDGSFHEADFWSDGASELDRSRSDVNTSPLVLIWECCDHVPGGAADIEYA